MADGVKRTQRPLPPQARKLEARSLAKPAAPAPSAPPWIKAGAPVQAAKDGLALGDTKPGKGSGVVTNPMPNEPKLPKLKDREIDGPVHWAELKGPIFDENLGPDEVLQGELNDCYFLSTIASAAQRHPQLLEDAIHQKPDGTYDVRFFAAQKNGPPTEVHVTVDGEFPEDQHGKPIFATARDGKEIWPEILEKGYAAFRKDFAEIDKGGYSSDVMSALTGKPAVSPQISPKNRDQVFAQLKDAIAKGQLTCAGIQCLSNRLDMYPKLLAPGVTAQNIDRTVGIRDGHAYTVLDVSEENGQKFVTVRDPWGEVGWEHEKASHGVIKMPLAQFSVLFNLVWIGDV